MNTKPAATNPVVECFNHLVLHGIVRPLSHPFMASDSSSSTAIPSTFSILVAEKLTKTNYRLWRAQIMPAIRAAHLEALLTGANEPPAETKWSASWFDCDESLTWRCLNSNLGHFHLFYLYLLFRLKNRVCLSHGV
jgi:hypothetical protein